MQKVKDEQLLVQTCLEYYPTIQAIYVFGSWGTEDERADSDVDVALLLPFPSFKPLKTLYGTALHQTLERMWMKDVDLIHLRHVSTILQNEVLKAERRIYCADEYAADEFEMLTLSFYQKLNEERADILQDVYRSKRAVE